MQDTPRTLTSSRIATVLTAVNACLLLAIIAGIVPTAGASPNVQPQTASVLRARALEIVDASGRIRASITVEPPTTVEGKQYPETVLLRLTDPTRGPLVKLQADSRGAALGLSDHQDGGVQLIARDTSIVRVLDPQGRVKQRIPSR